MVRFTGLLLLLCITSILACNRPITNVDMVSNDAKEIEINLDLPVEQRLKQLHDTFKDKAPAIVNNILDTLKKDIGGSLGLFVVKQAMKVFLYARAPEVLFDEIHSYSQATRIAPEIIALMNVFYEFDGTA